MTVCIAAVYVRTVSTVVVAADRMFTAAAPVNLEFETEEQKIEVLASSCVGLMSGATVVGTEVLDETKRKLGGSQSPMIADVARIVEAAYITVRGTKAHQAVVVPTLGPDFAAAQARGATLPAYLQPQAQVYQSADRLPRGRHAQIQLTRDSAERGPPPYRSRPHSHGASASSLVILLDELKLSWYK